MIVQHELSSTVILPLTGSMDVSLTHATVLEDAGRTPERDNAVTSGKSTSTPRDRLRKNAARKAFYMWSSVKVGTAE
jgi:hypothetical protein